MFRNAGDEAALEALTGHHFTDKRLLAQAVTRKSAFLEGRQDKAIGHNEALATLGDGLLRVVIDDILMELNPKYAKGGLSTERDKYVSNRALAAIASSNQLNQFLIMGKGEAKQHRNKQDTRVLADTLEAIIAALFLDSDRNYKVVKKFIIREWDFLKRYNDLLAAAISADNDQQVKYLLQCGVDPDLPMIEVLDAAGSSENEPFEMPSFPLMRATRKCNPAMVRVLLEAGAAVNQHFLGQTALYQAACQNSIHIAEILLRHGAAFTQEFSTGYTPLHVAAWRGHSEMVRFLLENGAEIDKKDFLGTSALHTAAANSNYDSVKILLERGAKVDNVSSNPSNDLLETPLHRAVSRGSIEVIRLLLSYGADLNRPDHAGHTCLHRAALRRDPLILQELLEHHPDLSIADKEGFYAHDLAVDANMKDLLFAAYKANRRVALPQGNNSSSARFFQPAVSQRATEDTPAPQSTQKSWFCNMQ